MLKDGVKFCKKCKYHIKRGIFGFRIAICIHESSFRKHRSLTYLVSGKDWIESFLTCETQRFYDDKCGITARYFEENA